jgi:hypothetical protein
VRFGWVFERLQGGILSKDKERKFLKETATVRHSISIKRLSYTRFPTQILVLAKAVAELGHCP